MSKVMAQVVKGDIPNERPFVFRGLLRTLFDGNATENLVL
jgi:hypothetical protein